MGKDGYRKPLGGVFQPSAEASLNTEYPPNLTVSRLTVSQFLSSHRGPLESSFSHPCGLYTVRFKSVCCWLPGHINFITILGPKCQCLSPPLLFFSCHLYGDVCSICLQPPSTVKGETTLILLCYRGLA